EIDVAREVLGEGGLAAVQNEFSPTFFHTSRNELRHCGEHGIAFVPWSPLGGTGGGASAVGARVEQMRRVAAAEAVGPAPRVGERFEQIRRIADAHAVSPQQVGLAWEIALGEHVIPIPGASRPESIKDSAAAMRLELTDAEREELDRLIA